MIPNPSNSTGLECKSQYPIKNKENKEDSWEKDKSYGRFLEIPIVCASSLLGIVLNVPNGGGHTVPKAILSLSGGYRIEIESLVETNRNPIAIRVTGLTNTNK